MPDVAWLVAAGIVLVGGLAPAAALAARGSAAHRMVGLQLTGSSTVPALVLLSLGMGRPDYLIVPLVLALLAFAGTLVFTRLLAARDG